MNYSALDPFAPFLESDLESDFMHDFEDRHSLLIADFVRGVAVPQEMFNTPNVSTADDYRRIDASFLKQVLDSLPPLGPKIVPAPNLLEQFRFPKSRKKRIRKKWAKRPENWRPSRKGYLDPVANVFYVHPDFLPKFNFNQPR